MTACNSPRTRWAVWVVGGSNSVLDIEPDCGGDSEIGPKIPIFGANSQTRFLRYGLELECWPRAPALWGGPHERQGPVDEHAHQRRTGRATTLLSGGTGKSSRRTLNLGTVASRAHTCPSGSC